jgi:mannose-1-phosphate guanylyltransferase
MVEIAGRPLLQIWLEQLSQFEHSGFIINTHYFAEQVEQFIFNSPFRDQVQLIYEPTLLGTLGTLRATRPYWEGHDVMVVHADNLCLCSWPLFLQAFNQRPEGCVGAMMCFQTDTPSSCGIVECDDDDRLMAFHEKVPNPPSHYANGAVYVFDDTLAGKLDVISGSDISLNLLPSLLGQMVCWPTDGYLRDIGTPQSLQRACADYPLL